MINIFNRDFQDHLDSEILKLLERIFQFSYRDFNIQEINKNVSVFLDNKTDRIEITRKREDVESEINRLTEQLKEIRNDVKRSEQDIIDEEMIPGRIRHLKEMIKGNPGQDEITITDTTEFLGYYTRQGRGKAPEVVLLMETLGNNPYSKWQVATTLIHEMFHAYYDHNLSKTGEHIPFVEEPLTEFAMLKFVEDFVSQNPNDKELLSQAQWAVRKKIHSSCFRHYGFGFYLWNFEHSNPKICDWIEEYRKSKYSISTRTNAYKSYVAAFKNGNYPLGAEYNTMVLLYELLCKAQGKKVTVLASPIISLPKGASKWKRLPVSVDGLENAYYCIVNDTLYLDGTFLIDKRDWDEIWHEIRHETHELKKVVLWDHFICKNISEIDKNSHLICYCRNTIAILVSPNNLYYVQDSCGLIYNREKTALYYCPENITGTVTLPNGLATIDNYALTRCSKLQTIVIPNSVTKIPEDAFSGCKSLTTEVVLNNTLLCVPKDVTQYEVPANVSEISYWAFNYCSQLKDLQIPNSVTKIPEGAFRDCESLTTEVVLNNTLLCVPKDVTQYEVPANVSEISHSAFDYCSQLKSISIAEGLEKIGYRVFKDCPISSIKFNGVVPPTIKGKDIVIPRNCVIRVPKGAKTDYQKIFKQYQIEEF